MICDRCKHEENCPAKAEYGGAKRCSAFKPQEMTNEEWFCGLSTEEKARLLVNNKLFFRMLDYDGFIEWLKEKHTIKE